MYLRFVKSDFLKWYLALHRATDTRVSESKLPEMIATKGVPALSSVLSWHKQKSEL